MLTLSSILSTFNHLTVSLVATCSLGQHSTGTWHFLSSPWCAYLQTLLQNGGVRLNQPTQPMYKSWHDSSIHRHFGRHCVRSACIEWCWLQRNSGKMLISGLDRVPLWRDQVSRCCHRCCLYLYADIYFRLSVQTSKLLRCITRHLGCSWWQMYTQHHIRPPNPLVPARYQNGESVWLCSSAFDNVTSRKHIILVPMTRSKMTWHIKLAQERHGDKTEIGKY